MKIKNIVLSLFVCLVMVVTMLPVIAYAEGPIETDRDVTFTISYKDGETPISGAAFDIYRCADIDAYGRMTATDAFASYPVNLDGLDQAGWQELAVTLKGYAQRDNLTAAASGKTDSNGELTVTLKPGLYLVVGSRQTNGDYTYTATPFMVFLPDRNDAENVWNYEASSSPKFTKTPNPPVDETITRKVLKKWDDKGYEETRPKEVIVQLLRDGKVYDTQTLNEDNDWMHTWSDLSADYEWTIVEKELDGYYTTVDQQGIAFIITNKYVVPYIVEDPPVVKKISGHTPPSASTFTFILAAQDASYPMPAGSTGTIKEITITGAGSKEFGEMVFTKPGTYIYTISEKNTGVEGYTYDTTVYTLRYTVTETDGELSTQLTITETNGRTVDSPVFTNKYKKPGSPPDEPEKPKLPQTGMRWWPIPLLLCLGLTFYVIGFLWKKQLKDDE